MCEGDFSILFYSILHLFFKTSPRPGAGFNQARREARARNHRVLRVQDGDRVLEQQHDFGGLGWRDSVLRARLQPLVETEARP